ncbi:endonuclease-reverse transcriptase [Apostichopus japonicus]|uniref:Endonuclease-reverse transcriptase n=1 Tax=Stichopus japonicus TaxID=307972 RepID=A0A2G8K274_STIJA|nr:endonuclease-reverse transcriptase [Apostichopus japonicus]
MKKYNMGQKLIQTIKQLYTKASSAVLLQGVVGDWFHTSVGVRQGCLLSPTLFNIFLERIMTDALENHNGTVSIGGRNITNLRFADDIDGLAGNEDELANLVSCLDDTSRKYGMEISAGKTKLMTNSTTPFTRNIVASGQQLETVNQFKYLGAIISEEGSKAEVLARAAQTAAALAKLKPIWNDRNISLRSKLKLLHALVCRSSCMHEVRRTVKQHIANYEDLLTTVRKRKLRWYGHVTRTDGLSKTILQGTVQGKRRRGRQRKRWVDNIKEWTGMNFATTQALAHDRQEWKRLMSSPLQRPYDPGRLRDQ